MAHRDGDGWVICRCGLRHWGLNGAAGLLLIRRDKVEPYVLLQLRAPWTHGGGTWALPGGAIDSHEDSISAAAREAAEEAGILASDIEVRDIYSDDHGTWHYDTVIAHSNGDAGAFAANAESEDIRWVLLNDVESFSLHAGLAAAWPQLHQRILATLA